MRDVALVVLARAPERGRVKSRLAATLGDERALEVYRQLLAITARAVSQWCGPVVLASTGDATLFAGSGLEHFPRVEQAEGGLGTRIAAALRAGLDISRRAIAIGSDCSGLRVTHLRGVAARLSAVPAALGPASDGGFWAVAASQIRVVEAIAADALPWSTQDTLAAVRAHLDSLGIATDLGPLLSDCDTEVDLARAMDAGELRMPDPESASATGCRGSARSRAFP